MKRQIRKVIAMLLCVVMVLSSLPVRPHAEEFVIPIYTAEEFLAILDAPAASYRLEANLDLGTIAPRGFHPGAWSPDAFSGSLDGNGHSIRYRIEPMEGLSYYGLFSASSGAKFSNLILDCQIDAHLTEYGLIGSVVADAVNTTFANIVTSGEIRVTSDDDGTEDRLSMGGICSGNAVCHSCIVNLNVDAQMDPSDWVIYDGISKGVQYSCDLGGQVKLAGYIREAVLLRNAMNSSSSVSLDVSVASSASVYGDLDGTGNRIYGAIHLQPHPNQPADRDLAGSVYGLSGSSDCSFIGEISSSIPMVSLAAAYRCVNAKVIANLSAQDRIQENYRENVIHGLLECTHSSMEGQIDLSCTKGRVLPLSNSSYCSYTGDASFSTKEYSDLFAVFGGEFNRFEGSISGYSSHSGAGVFPVGGNAGNSAFYGDCHASCAGDSYAVSYASDGIGNIVCANITALNEENSGGVSFLGSNCYYEGTVTTGVVTDTSVNSSILADIHALDGSASIAAGSNVYFGGSVSVRGVENYSTSVSVGTGSNCVVNADVDVYHPGAANPYKRVYTYPNCGFSFGSATTSFNGSARITAIGGEVRGKTSIPVQIDHRQAGSWNSRNIGISVDVHNGNDCRYHKEGEFFHHAKSGDHPCGYSYGWQSHWGAYISAEAIEGVSADTASAGWDGMISPENGEYSPERDPISYTIVVVDVNNQPMSRAYLILDGETHSLDSSGSYTVENGPALIRKLEVMMVDERTGEMVTMATRTSYCPFPNMTNVLRLEPNLNLRLNFLGVGGKEGERDTFRIPGVDFDFDFPMSMDIQGSLGDSFSFQTKLDPISGRMRVMAGSTQSGGKHPNMQWDHFKNLRDCVHYGLLGQPHFEDAEEILRGATAKKTNLGIATWDLRGVGVLELDYNPNLGEWEFVEVGLMIGGSADYRITTPIATIPGLYWTGSVKGDVEFFAGDNGPGGDDPADTVVNLYAKITPGVRVEAAVGAGVRNARLYGEIGLGGEAKLDVESPFISLQESFKATGIFDVFAEFCVMSFSKRTKLLEATVIWPEPDPKKANLLMSQLTEGEMAIAPRTYAEGLPSVRAAGETAGFLGLSSENSYPYSQVMLIPLSNGRFLLLYTDDALSRGDADRSALRACIGTQTGGDVQWGVPVTVEDDGTGDYGFHAAVSGDRVAVVWQDATNTFGNGQDLTPADAARQVVLSETILDCSGEMPVAGAVAAVSSEGSYPYYPTIYYDGDRVRTGWVTTSNPDPSVYTEDEVETLWLSEGFGNPGAAVAEGQKSIRGTALIRDSFLWSTENTLWRYADDSGISQADTGEILHLQSNGRAMCYVKDNALYQGDKIWSQVKYSGYGEAYNESLRLSADGTVYAGQGGLRASRICRMEDGKALPVAEFSGFLSSWDAANGQVVSVTRSGFDDGDTSGFMSQAQTLLESMELSDLSWENVTPGSQATCKMTVENNGGAVMDSLPVTVVCEDGTELYRGEVYCMAEPGESVRISFDFMLPEEYQTQRVTVTIGGESLVETLGGTNLQLEAAWNVARADGIMATVTNTGTEDAGGSVTMTDENGTVLDTREVRVAAGQKTELWFGFREYFREDALLYLELTESENAISTADNAVVVAVLPIEAGMIRVQDSLILKKGQTAPLEIRLIPEGSMMPALNYTSADVRVVRVDQNGVVTGVSAGSTTVAVTTADGAAHVVTVTVVEEESGNPFTDVPEGEFYYKPVMWAVENGITNGATETTYNPNGTCLRAQVVTFLHRAAGNPEPTSTRNPFTDVMTGDFFYKPVLWAVEKGITNGTTATTFGSYANCNRAAVVTFLWRAAGSPEPKSTTNPFVDVKTTDFFYKSVLWAVENGITNGVDATHFGPTADCNRAQVVTFLYRAYN